MTNQQLYIALAVPSVVALLGILTTLTTFVVTNQAINKRLDEMRADMKDGFARVDRQFDHVERRFEQVNLTMDAMRQDIADIKANQRGHDVEIANLKERAK